ncbi:hypothetical protein N8I74_18245 [Chitiniphilus purpureus]|uniref:DUF4240 domain-containing protein n=1 Tax=Chitiniphilus purpureus TaxID=2981137 RepID=A0ABY6DLZ5_9NEIS|nr:hypothetical protein [Chitiniphilus sp. CD1]UXY15228.1 hypothetical protein N8I74_18245 [Chitiniphilus sp. CD1]
MNAIQQFWLWFKSHEQPLLHAYAQSKSWEEIDFNLERIHERLAWEIGPANEERMYFAISPDFDEDLMPVAAQVVSQAYASDFWDFRLGRQRRPWSEVVEIAQAQGEDDARETVDISGWRHIVFRLQDSNLVDIVFECGEGFPLVADALDELGAVVAAALVGEMTIMEKVDAIEVVERFESRFQSKAKPAAWLPYAFEMKPL